MAITGDTAETEATFALDSTLDALVRPAVGRRTDVRLELSGGGSIVVLATVGRYWIEGRDPVSVCGEDRRAYRVKSQRSRPEPPAQITASGSVEELFWTIGYAASQGRLVDALSPTDVLQVTEWPNLTRVPLGPHGLRLAVLMRRRPTSIPVAARLARAPRDHVHRVLSAAWAAGLLRTINRASNPSESRESIEEADSMSIVQSLLRRLRRE